MNGKYTNGSLLRERDKLQSKVFDLQKELAEVNRESKALQDRIEILESIRDGLADRASGAEERERRLLSVLEDVLRVVPVGLPGTLLSAEREEKIDSVIRTAKKVIEERNSQ